MKSSKGRSLHWSLHQRKQDDITNRRAVGQQHDEPIDADALAGGRRQAVLEGADVVLVHDVRFEVAGGPAGQLGLEAAALLRRIVELAEGVGHLEAADVELEALDRLGVVGLLLRQGRDLGREVVDERRLHEVVLVQPLEDFGRDPAGAPPGLQLEAQLAGEVGGGLALAQVRVGHRHAQPLARRPCGRPRGARRGGTAPPARSACSPNVIWSVPIDSRATLEIISSVMTISA